MMTKNAKKSRRGFTLVEVMISVLIIGILLSIAAPNLVKARESSRAKSCVANLAKIEGAKEMWAMDTRARPNASPSMTVLVGPTAYLKNTPECPSNGGYMIGDLTTRPRCTIGTNGTGDQDDHILQ
jgi:prepilin-type N-terminal cleavage/methylation domain-containing protein